MPGRANNGTASFIVADAGCPTGVAVTGTTEDLMGNISSFFDESEMVEIAAQLGIRSETDAAPTHECTPLCVEELVQTISADQGTRDLLFRALGGHVSSTPSSLHLRLGGQEYLFQVPLNSDDAVSSMLEVLGHRIYEHPRYPVEQVLDLGAYIGMSTIYLHSIYDQASFVCVEPSPGNCAYLVTNLRNNQCIRADWVHAAIGGSTETARVRVKPGVAMTNSTVFTHSHGGWETVPCIRLRNLVSAGKYGIKVDIEGAEFDMSIDADILAGAEWIMGELHYGFFSKPADGWLKKLLRAEFDFNAEKPRVNGSGAEVVVAQNFTAFKK